VRDRNAKINVSRFGGFRSSADDPPKPWRRWVWFWGPRACPWGSINLRYGLGDSNKPSKNEGFTLLCSGKLVLQLMITKGNKQKRQGHFGPCLCMSSVWLAFPRRSVRFQLFSTDTGNLHQNISWQSRYLNGFTGWETLSEIGGINRVELRKIIHIL